MKEEWSGMNLLITFCTDRDRFGHTDVVEAARGQPLGEVGGKQEAGEEGEEQVVTVTGEGVTRAAALPEANQCLRIEELHRYHISDCITNKLIL